MVWSTPKTWAVGDPATASDLNGYIRDNTAYLYGDTSFTSITPAAGWVNFGGGYAVLGVRRFGPMVMVQGTLTNNSGAAQSPGSADQIAGTVPSGYTPPASQSLSGDSSAGYVRWTVTTSGVIQIGEGSVPAGSYATVHGIYSLI